MIRGPPRFPLDRSSAASDVYKRQNLLSNAVKFSPEDSGVVRVALAAAAGGVELIVSDLSLIHISEPTRPY